MISHRIVGPWRHHVILVLTALISVVVYAHALGAHFIEDDWVYLNEVQKSGWSSSSTLWNPSNILWRPLLYIWFGLLHGAFGLDPLPYHLATEAIVLVGACLTYRLARQQGMGTAAVIAGAVVCLHPSMATPVAWTSAASSPLAVAFALGALLSLGSARPRRGRGLLAASLLACGLLTREVVVVTPAIFVVLSFLGSRTTASRRRTLVESLWLWAVVVAYDTVRLVAGFGSTGPYHQGLSAQAVHNLVHLAEYATGLFFPAHLHATELISTLLWVVAILLAIGAARRGRRQGLAGLVWAVLAILPVVFLTAHPVDAYYVDFALPGLGLAAAAVVQWLITDRRRRVHLKLVAASVGALCVVANFAVARMETNAVFAGPARRTALIERQLRTETSPTNGWHASTHGGHRCGPLHHRQRRPLYRVLLHDPQLRIISAVSLDP